MPTSARVAAALAWGLAIPALIMVALALVMWAGRDFSALPVSFGSGILGVIGLVVSPLAYITFGALLAARIWRNAVGWLLLGCGLLLATMLPINMLVAMAHESLRPPDPLVVAVAWLRNAFATPGVAVLLIAAVYLFPDGRPISARWSLGIAVGVLGGALLALGGVLNHEGMVTYPTLSNPTAVSADLSPIVDAIQVTGVTLTVVAAIHAIASLAIRYRRGDRVGRAQLRWILLATMLTGFAAIPFLLTRYLLDVGNALGEVASLGIQLAMSTFPIVATVAISHHRLYQVDLLIGRTLVYVPLMAILGGLYTTSIALFQRVFVALTGETSDAAIVLTVLLVGSLFTPLRRTLEGTLEKRFPTQPAGGADLGPGPGAMPRTHPVTAAAPAIVPLANVLAIGADGMVKCPVRGIRVPVSTCLECPQLQAIAKSPRRAVVCTGVATRPS